jgi:pimeloyl-ACP methyl ester carboxylesterase
MPDDQLATLRAEPSWPGRVAAAHTLVRECRAEEAYRFDPARFEGLDIPVLLLAGSETPPAVAASIATLAATFAAARVVMMADQGHVAMTTAPELFATELLRFLSWSG